jgi:CubicO group peptidase (beta-lactamase class C family)
MTSDIVDLASELADERIFCSALQVAVRGTGSSISFATGEMVPGVSVHADTLFSVHCATKPILALAVGMLVDEHGVDLGAEVREVVSPSSPFSECRFSVWSVLDHVAPLARPSLTEINLMPPEAWPDALREGVQARARGYSEFASQALLADVVEWVTGSPASTVVREAVLGPIGLADRVFYGFRGRETRLAHAKRGLYVRGLPVAQLPMLHDWSPHQTMLDRMCLGGYTSAEALADLYEAVGRVHSGQRVPGLPVPSTLSVMLKRRSDRRDDPVLGRHCRFAGGFMVELHDHGYGDTLRAGSFGHSGLLGSSFGFYDSESGVSGAVITNGLNRTHLDLDFVRTRLVAAMVSFATAPGSGSDALVEQGSEDVTSPSC